MVDGRFRGALVGTGAVEAGEARRSWRRWRQASSSEVKEMAAVGGGEEDGRRGPSSPELQRTLAPAMWWLPVAGARATKSVKRLLSLFLGLKFTVLERCARRESKSCARML
jgi:hypothetical protein